MPGTYTDATGILRPPILSTRIVTSLQFLGICLKSFFLLTYMQERILPSCSALFTLVDIMDSILKPTPVISVLS
jgi:hypothetical protein